jgi:hypothetical protein
MFTVDFYNGSVGFFEILYFYCPLLQKHIRENMNIGLQLIVSIYDHINNQIIQKIKDIF